MMNYSRLSSQRERTAVRGRFSSGNPRGGELRGVQVPRIPRGVERLTSSMKFGFQEEMMIMRDARKRRRIGFAFFFILSLGLSTSAPAQANRGTSAPAGTQERLVAGLANPDKEQRMEALVELSA